MRVRALEIPPVRDGFVIGRAAAAGWPLFAAALEPGRADSFVSIPLKDPVVKTILVRRSALRRIDPVRLRQFILKRIKPLMNKSDVLALRLDVTVTLAAFAGQRANFFAFEGSDR